MREAQRPGDMNLPRQMLFWVLVLIALLALAWLFSDVLLPFVVGITVAYLLNPVVDLLGRYGLPRLPATCLILLAFILAMALLLALAIPALYQEAAQLARAAPGYADILWQHLEPYLGSVQPQVESEVLRDSLRQTLRDNATNLLNLSSNLLAGLVTGGRALMSFLSLVFLAPLVAFMMMLEFEAIASWVDNQIPRQHHQVIRSLLQKIDAKVAGFIRGQLLVALALGILYALCLTLAGLQFGFLIGAGAGLLSVIPLFGSSVGLLVAVTTAWFQTGEIGFVALIGGIFIAGQILEGNVITPRLMGQSVGLHPLWILFALLAGGAFLGVLGMMIAIPLAAALGVLLGFALDQYRQSYYYREKLKAQNGDDS